MREERREEDRQGNRERERETERERKGEKERERGAWGVGRGSMGSWVEEWVNGQRWGCGGKKERWE